MTHVLRDFIVVVRRYGFVRFLKRVYDEVNSDNVFTNAAAVAYAWMFAIFPFLIFVISLFPYLPLSVRARTTDAITTLITENLTSPSAADALTQAMTGLINKPQSGLLSFGLLLTIYAASGGMNTTMSAIDQAFDVQKPRTYIRKRVIAMVLTIFTSISLLIIALAMPIGSVLTTMVERYSDKLPTWTHSVLGTTTLILFTVVRYLIGLTVLQVLISVILHFGRSEREDRMTLFSPGALLAAAGWLICGFGMRIYAANFGNFNKTYGTVAGMVIMLMIFYINAIMILVGAELDSEVKHVKSELNSHFRPEPQTSLPQA